jgi:hypothetical protein
LQELVHLIDTARGEHDRPLTFGVLDVHFDAGAEIDATASFIEVSLEFYPELAKHYWFAFQKWALDKSELPPSPERLEAEQRGREFEAEYDALLAHFNSGPGQ